VANYKEHSPFFPSYVIYVEMSNN